MNKLFVRLFENKRTSVRTTTDKNSISSVELQKLILMSSNRVRGLRSTIKQYSAMSDSDIKEARKKHYTKLKEVGTKLLDREEIELNTLNRKLIDSTL